MPKCCCQKWTLKLIIDINILRFWIHLQNLPDDNITKQCFQLSFKIWLRNISKAYHKRLKHYVMNYNSSHSMILNESNGKSFISSIAKKLNGCPVTLFVHAHFCSRAWDFCIFVSVQHNFVQTVSVKCRLRTANCGPGVKCRLSEKWKLQTDSKT